MTLRVPVLRAVVSGVQLAFIQPPSALDVRPCATARNPLKGMVRAPVPHTVTPWSHHIRGEDAMWCAPWRDI